MMKSEGFSKQRLTKSSLTPERVAPPTNEADPKRNLSRKQKILERNIVAGV